MSKLKFKQGIIRVWSPALEAQGYVCVGPKFPGSLFYRKTLAQIGMECSIGVQLSEHALPPRKRQFTVLVSRGEDQTAGVAAGGKPLGSRLPELLHFHFNIPVYLEGHGWWGDPPSAEVGQPGPPLHLPISGWWQFDTQEEFEAQLANALDYLLRYAIPWLEDPQSELPPWGYMGPPPIEPGDGQQ